MNQPERTFKITIETVDGTMLDGKHYPSAEVASSLYMRKNGGGEMLAGLILEDIENLLDAAAEEFSELSGTYVPATEQLLALQGPLRAASQAIGKGTPDINPEFPRSRFAG